MGSANERQHGGDHYGGGEYQHWDWVTDIRLSYLLATASKYVGRWRKKGVPKLDLEKALHYLDKAAEKHQTGSSVHNRAEYYWRYVTQNAVNMYDAMTLYHIMEGNIPAAKAAIQAMMPVE